MKIATLSFAKSVGDGVYEELRLDTSDIDPPKPPDQVEATAN
jgi:hypothetical protein